MTTDARAVLCESVGAALLCLGLPGAAQAQWSVEPRFQEADRAAAIAAAPSAAVLGAPGPAGGAGAPVLPVETAGRGASDASLVAAGVAGAAAGFVGGAIVRYRTERAWFWCGCDDPGLLGGLLGAYLGPAILTPFFVNTANRHGGSIRKEYAASLMIAGIGFVGLGVTATTPLAPALFFLTPVAQVVSAVMIERGSARARERGEP